MRRNHFQPHNRRNKRGDEEEAHEGGGFTEKEYAQQHGAYGADARPYGVGGADGQGLGGFDQEGHADGQGEGKAGVPAVDFGAGALFGLGEAEGKAYFKQAGYNEYDPVHTANMAFFGPETMGLR